jgi:hypothetical protein
VQKWKPLIGLAVLISAVAFLMAAAFFGRSVEGAFSTEIVGYHSKDTFMAFDQGNVYLVPFGDFSERTPLGHYFRTNGFWLWQYKKTSWRIDPGIFSHTVSETSNPTNVFRLTRKWLGSHSIPEK